MDIWSNGRIKMMKKHILPLLILLIVGFTNIYGFQYMTDRDKKELLDLRNIQPPLGAIELGFVRSFPSEEDEAAGNYFSSPVCVEMDAKGNFYIADQKTNVIYKFDSTGKYIDRYGKPGQGPGDISLPLNVKVADDEIIVHEAGNMRLQYIGMDGIYKKSIRLFKSYMDLDLLKDGRVVGANLSVESQQSNTLIDVLSPEGRRIRSFGTPIDFKYDRSVLNNRRIFIDSQNEVLQLFTYLAIIQRYSLQGELLQESKMETEYSAAKDKINRRLNSYRPNEIVGYSSWFRAGTIHDDHIFIVDFVSPRIWIWEIDKKFHITKRYWANMGSSIYVRDIHVSRNRESLLFYLLGDIGDDVTKIHIFVPK
jgi:hypothetical protein